MSGPMSEGGMPEKGGPDEPIKLPPGRSPRAERERREEERNVVPPEDDEELDEKLTTEDFWGGSSHFHRYVSEGNQRSYLRPRGTRDSA